MVLVLALGLDLSLRSTGFAVPSRGVFGRIRTDKSMSMESSLQHIRDELSAVVESVAPEVAYVEEGLYRTQVAGMLGMVHGVVRLMLFERNIPIVLVAPASLKKHATGHGRADKKQMVEAAQHLGYVGKNSDEADAWLLGCWHLIQP